MSDDRRPEDPFEALNDDVRDADEEDPFAALAEPDEDDGENEGDGESESDGENGGAHTVAGPVGSGEAAEDDPFAALSDAGTFDHEDPFERMEVDDLGDDSVWEALDADDEYDGVGPGAVTDGVDQIVNKRIYCQRCPHLSEPPHTTCTHEEGEILEVLEGSEFRVRNCPMIGEEGPRFDRNV